MSKSTVPHFILNLKLHTEKYQNNTLNKRFEISRQLYNSVLHIALNRYKELIKTKIWRNNQLELSKIYKLSKNDKNLKKICKPYYDIKSELLKQYKLTKYSFHADIKPMQHHFKENIDSFTAQKIASRVWKAINDNLFGKGKDVHFKKYYQ